MGGFKTDITINAKPDVVFSELIDINNAAKLLSGIGEIKLLTPGNMRQGSRLLETRTFHGRTETVEIEISEYIPHSRYAARNDANGVEIIYLYDVKPHGLGSKVEFECKVAARGLKKLMVPLIVGMLRKEDGKHLERLKDLLEAKV